MICSKVIEMIRYNKIFSIVVLSISISIIFNPSFVFGAKDNTAADNNSLKDYEYYDVTSFKELEYAKTLQDLTEKDRNMYYGEDILSEKAIQNRIDVCEEMQSKDILSIKVDCKEYINTLNGVDIIIDYVVDQAFND